MIEHGTTYHITPAVLEDGMPAWELWRETINPSAALGLSVLDRKFLAKNRDRAVLENAIVHLQSGAVPKEAA